jgi:hypothetical protein
MLLSDIEKAKKKIPLNFKYNYTLKYLKFNYLILSNFILITFFNVNYDGLVDYYCKRCNYKKLM